MRDLIAPQTITTRTAKLIGPRYRVDLAGTDLVDLAHALDAAVQHADQASPRGVAYAGLRDAVHVALYGKTMPGCSG